MISLIFLFYFIIYPYLMFTYFSRKHENNIFNNTTIINSSNSYNIYIISTQDENINPYYKKNKYNLKIIFEIPDDCDKDVLENKIKYFKTSHFIFQNYISLILDISEENENYIENIIKYARYLYPTYSKIIFVYYESIPFISQLLRNNINNMNNDTTRNYFMVNIKSLIYKVNETKKNIDFLYIDNNLKLLQSDKDKYNEKFQETIDPFVTEYLSTKDVIDDTNNLYQELI